MGKTVLIVNRGSLLLLIPQLLSMFVLVALAEYVIRPEIVTTSVIVGISTFLVYSQSSRLILLTHHRRGMRHTKRGEFADAIASFEKSYEFLSNHSWIDRFRWIVMMSPSEMQYREMALVNIAHCNMQLENVKAAKEFYEKTLREFPESVMAKSSMNFIETIEHQRDAVDIP